MNAEQYELARHVWRTYRRTLPYSFHRQSSGLDLMGNKRLFRFDESDYNGFEINWWGNTLKTASVSELKSHLSEYLRQVKAGTEVLVTDRGRPVALLVPVSGVKTERESMVHMQKQGLIKLGSGKLPQDFWSMSRPQDPEGMVLKALLEEREAGR